MKTLTEQMQTYRAALEESSIKSSPEIQQLLQKIQSLRAELNKVGEALSELLQPTPEEEESAGIAIEEGWGAAGTCDDAWAWALTLYSHRKMYEEDGEDSEITPNENTN